MIEHTRMSVASVVATSGGSVAAACLLLSASLVFASPTTKPGQGGSQGSGAPVGAIAGLDLPMGAPVYGKPAVAPAAPWVPEQNTDDGDDPRDTPPPTFFGEDLEAETDSILYVIDNSGSMSIVSNPFEDQNGQIIASGNRLDRAKAELKRSIGGLPESFYFNIFFYDECAMAWQATKQPATDANKSAAFAWIDAVQPDGWTNTGFAVQTALADKENTQIVLLSDGAPNFLDCAMNYVGSFDEHANLIKTANTQGAVINTFGIGISSDPDARSFMVRVAAENGGTYNEVN